MLWADQYTLSFAVVPGMCRNDAQYITLSTTVKSGAVAIGWFPQLGAFGKAVDYELYLFSLYPVCVGRVATSALFNHQQVFCRA